jgi:hypothetical protein
MLLFRRGSSADGFYFNHPWVYWVESAAWITASWYLFPKISGPKVPSYHHRRLFEPRIQAPV